jgi:hypothetical protein
MITWVSVTARTMSSGETPGGSGSPCSLKNIDAGASSSMPVQVVAA